MQQQPLDFLYSNYDFPNRETIRFHVPTIRTGSGDYQFPITLYWNYKSACPNTRARQFAFEHFRSLYPMFIIRLTFDGSEETFLVDLSLTNEQLSENLNQFVKDRNFEKPIVRCHKRLEEIYRDNLRTATSARKYGKKETQTIVSELSRQPYPTYYPVEGDEMPQPVDEARFSPVVSNPWAPPAKKSSSRQASTDTVKHNPHKK